MYFVDVPSNVNTLRNHLSLCGRNRLESRSEELLTGFVVLRAERVFQSNEQARSLGNRWPLDYPVLRMVVGFLCRWRLRVHRVIRLLTGLLAALLVLLAAGDCGVSGCGEKSRGSQKHFCELHMLLLNN
jgi:hypothetical protein